MSYISWVDLKKEITTSDRLLKDVPFCQQEISLYKIITKEKKNKKNISK